MPTPTDVFAVMTGHNLCAWQ